MNISRNTYIILISALSGVAVALVGFYLYNKRYDIRGGLKDMSSRAKGLGQRVWGQAKRSGSTHKDNLIHTERDPLAPNQGF